MIKRLLKKLRKPRTIIKWEAAGEIYAIDGEIWWTWPFTFSKHLVGRHIKTNTEMNVHFGCSFFSLFRPRKKCHGADLVLHVLGLIEQGLSPAALPHVVTEAKKLSVNTKIIKGGYKGIQDFITKVSAPAFKPTDREAEFVKDIA